MKSKDIEAGRVYAYRRGQTGRIEQVVFFEPPVKGNLYSTRRDAGKGKPAFVADPGAIRTYSAPGYSGANDTGWLVAIGEEVSGATLDEALYSPAYVEDRPYHYTVLTNTTCVIGDYAEVAARIAEDALRDREVRRAAEAANVAQTRRMGVLSGRLFGHGVHATLATRLGPWTDTEYDRGHYPPTSFRMSEADAAHLADLLDAITGKADNAAQEA